MKKHNKRRSGLSGEGEPKSLLHVREELTRIRSNVIALLDERHQINSELVALYTGSDVDPHGLPVSETYQKKRMSAAKQAHKRLQGRAKTVKQLSKISDSAKIHLYDLMNKKIIAESNLELFKYRFKHEKHSRKDRKLILKDIRDTRKTVENLERDIKGFLKRAVAKQRDLTSGVWAQTIIVMLVLLALGIGALGFIFKTEALAVINWIKNLFVTA